MSLDNIFAAVEPLVLANLVFMGVANTTFGHIGLERVQEAAPPRVSWMPKDEDFQAPRGQGGDGVGPGVTQPLYTRVVDCDVDIWGSSRPAVETMIDCVVSGVHDALSGGSYGIAGATWLLPEAAGKNGEAYRVTFQFMVPVRRVTPGTTTAPVTSIPMTTSTSFNPGS